MVVIPLILKMKAVINNIIVSGTTAEEISNISAFVSYFSTNIGMDEVMIVNKLDELGLTYEAFDEFDVVGTRPKNIRH